MVLNTSVAESLKQFADELENAENFDDALNRLIRKTIKKHKRILFSGNGYDDAWIAEAEARGLSNLKTTPDALPYYVAEKNIKLFTDHKVFTETEMYARYEINLENYTKIIRIEARTMLDMAKKDILPAVSAFVKTLCDTVVSRRAAISEIPCTYEEKQIREISELINKMYNDVSLLEKELVKTAQIDNAQKLADYYKEIVLSRMAKIRESADRMECLTERKYWPYPTYADLLFGVR